MDDQPSAAFQGFYIHNDPDMRHISAQVPRDNIARGIILGVQRNRKTLAFAAEKCHQVGYAAVIDARIRMHLVPFYFGRIIRPIVHHVFVNFLLQIDANGPIGANNFVGADAGAGRDVSSGIVEMDVGGNVLYGMSCALDCRGHEFIEELLSGIYARGSALCEAKRCKQAHTKQCDPGFCAEVFYHAAILPAVFHPHDGVRAALSNAQRSS